MTLKSPFGSPAPIRRATKWGEQHYAEMSTTLILGNQSSLGHLYGSSGLPYCVPDSLQGGQNFGFMFLPNYRAWVSLPRLPAILRGFSSHAGEFLDADVAELGPHELLVFDFRDDGA